MTRKESITIQRLPILIVVIVMAASRALAAGIEGKVLYRFQGSPDASIPLGNLVADQAGNLYGTTSEGGDSSNCSHGCGTVFELIRPSSPGGNWTEVILYSFQNGTDGAGPLGGLVFDQSGNLYGTASSTVFELTPPSEVGGTWTETTLYTFGTHSNDGGGPMGSLIFDKVGNLYGTTFSGGSHAWGTVFEVSPPSSPGGAWTESVIYNFTGGSDGGEPYNGLILDNKGALYGTTSFGGRYVPHGIVFELAPPAVPGGAWSERVLYAFGGQANDGTIPLGSLVFDAAGNLIGTTSAGGSHNCPNQSGCGTVFQLTRPSASAPDSAWAETILYNFAGGTDGSCPTSNVTFDNQGALYGTTISGGGNNPPGQKCLFDSCGTAFQLTPPATPGGSWTEQVLHRFGSQLGDGIWPTSGLVRLGHEFYGVTQDGGGLPPTCWSGNGCGTVFALRVP